MFADEIDYPMAVASHDDGGVKAAIQWCTGQMEKDDTLTVWTKLKSNLHNNPALERLVNKHSNVDHIVGRGGGSVRSRGPVLMAWAYPDDIGKLVQFSGALIRALCVISWNEKRLRPWVAEVKPTVLGDGSAWEQPTPRLDPVVVEAMIDLTHTINHSNTISAGFEKDDVVSTLLAVHDAGIPMDGEAMQAWALGHGWSGENPRRLAEYVRDINAGKRPRHDHMLRADYVDVLRRRADGLEDIED